jgi:hypothetical protein
MQKCIDSLIVCSVKCWDETRRGFYLCITLQNSQFSSNAEKKNLVSLQSDCRISPRDRSYMEEKENFFLAEKKLNLQVINSIDVLDAKMTIWQSYCNCAQFFLS